ncbi:MAG: PAS domain S-box protein [Coprothermobacterota bacterium]|nr:PAS domain S-box protein [Coprothermobacterota bacterium]
MAKEGDLFRRVVETTNEGIWILDRNFRIVFANRRMEEMLGYDLEEMIGRPVEDFIPESEIANHMQRTERRRSGYSERYERLLRKKDGSSLPVLISATPILESGIFQGSFAMISDISQIREVERELYNTLEELRVLQLIVDKSPAVAFVWKVGMEGPVQFVTENISQWGYTKEELESGKIAFSEIVHPEDRERVIAEILRFTEEGKPEFRQHYRILTRDGQTRWVDDITFLNRDPSGRVLNYQGIVLDVTERKILEREAEEAGLRLQAFLEASPDLIYLKDLEGRNLIVNTAYAHYFGMNKREIEGKTDKEIMPPQLAEQCAKSDLQVLKSKTPIRVEEAMRNEKGERVFDTIKFPIRDANGKIMGIGGISRDITEKKRIEEALQETEQNLRGFFETLQESALLLDVESNVIFANKTASCRIGIPLEKLLGANLYEVLDPELKGWFRSRLKQVRKSGKPLVEEQMIADRSFLFQIYPMKTMRGRVERLVVLAIDITERKRIEEEREKVKNSLIYSVSHDLKTPLMVMQTAMEIISNLDAKEKGEKFLEYEPLWRSNLNRLKRLVDNLLLSQRALLSRISVYPRTVDAAVLLEDVAAELQGYAQTSNVKLETRKQEKPLFWELDQELIVSALENLLSNAIKFSPRGEKVIAGVKREGDQLVFWIEDRGPGIAKEEMEELFQPFRRTSLAEKKEIPGTGLGLFVARRLVEAHGGKLTLESAPGKGTKAVITIPSRKG